MEATETAFGTWQTLGWGISKNVAFLLVFILCDT
jgi:hypothetical protein